MDTVGITPNLAMLRVHGWQVYVWRDGDAVTVIDTGAPGSGPEILSAVPRIDRIVLTHGHVDHCGSAAELQDATGATVFAGAGDAEVIRSGGAMPPPVFEDWEIPIHQRVSAGLPEAAPAVAGLEELRDGDVLDFGGGAEVLAIPGHTDGSIAIHLPGHGVCCSPVTPSPTSGPSCSARSTRTGHKPSHRSSGWPLWMSTPPASATATRSPPPLRPRSATWLPH